MATSNQSGAQAAVVGTEHQLGAAITTPGTYVLVIDGSNLANGDTVELRARTKCKAGSASRGAYTATYSHAQVEANKYSVPIPVDTEVVFTLKQTAGAGRSFDWNILSL